MSLRHGYRYKQYLRNPKLRVPRETSRRQRRLNDEGMPSTDVGNGDNMRQQMHSNITEDLRTFPSNAVPEMTANQDSNSLYYLPDGESLVSEKSSVTRGQLFSMVFALFLKHNLTQAALKDLISLLNVVLPGCLPHSFYFFDKVTDVTKMIVTYVYCFKCENFIGKYDGSIKSAVCEQCSVVIDMDDMIKRGCYFLMCPLELSLRDLLENHSVGTILYDRYAQDVSSTRDKLTLGDISDGSLPSAKRHGCFPSSLSLTCNVDGVPVFKSNNMSMWPVYYTSNDLPLCERRQKVVLHAIWCGSGKPNMNCYLKPVVDELVSLHERKLRWTTNRGTAVETTICLDVVVCDSVARPLLQNFKQFNGKFGCGYCLHEGEIISKGSGSVRVYPAAVDLPAERTHAQSLLFAEEAVANGCTTFGVKGYSLFYDIPHFDIVSAFTPDYMHSVLLGVVRQFASLWFDTSSHGNVYYLRPKIDDIDAVILKCKPPSEVKRLPRSINLRKYWKASEWRSFLLFYSTVGLQSIMPAKYYTHWLLLVFSIYHLLVKNVRRDFLVLCDLALNKFVAQLPDLYGREHVSYNVHLLTHLVKSVEQWGPLWGTSAFIFEDANQKVLRMFHGARAVSRQIFKSYLLSTHLHPLATTFIKPYGESEVSKLFCKLSGERINCAKAVAFNDDVTALGVGKRSVLSTTEVLALERLLGHRVTNKTVTKFSRIICKGQVMHTSSYSSNCRRNDSLFLLRNNTGVFELYSCVQLSDSSLLFFIFSRYITRPLRVSCSDSGTNLLRHVLKADKSNVLIACHSNELIGKCIGLTDLKGQFYAIPLPTFELD